jgi:hypothetical protein
LGVTSQLVPPYCGHAILAWITLIGLDNPYWIGLDNPNWITLKKPKPCLSNPL